MEWFFVIAATAVVILLHDIKREIGKHSQATRVQNEILNEMHRLISRHFPD